MKGFIFTEFLELVEAKFGLAMVDEIIQKSDLKSSGAYTAVGNYEFSELLQLITHLGKNTNISVDDLLLVYAEHLFKVLVRTHPNLVALYKTPMDMLASIENHIHIEVQKIYPDAQLPSFKLETVTDTKMVMLYTSDKALYMLGKGLMLETFKLFNKKAEITLEKLNAKGTKVRYTITQLNA